MFIVVLKGTIQARDNGTFSDDLSWNVFIVSHSFVHAETDRKSCVKNEKSELKGEV